MEKLSLKFISEFSDFFFENFIKSTQNKAVKNIRNSKLRQLT